MNQSKIPLICIVGPTASGKTALSVNIAKLFDAEIVSADSMQIYRGMDIATAKPTKEEQQGIVHHMMDFLDNSEQFSVARYCDMAHEIIKDIHSRGKLAVLVGGTGLYVDSLINNITFSDSEGDEKLRNELQKECDEYGVEHLLRKLAVFDKESAEKLEETKNPKRIIRAIEVFMTTGKTIAQYNEESRKNGSPYKAVKIGLTATDRQFLYDRINKRVDIMVENGLVEEAKETYSNNLSTTASVAIGHKELIPYLEGEAELSECIEILKMQTRRYAKRQLTWFNRDKEIHWLNIDVCNNETLIEESVDVIKKVLFNE